MNNFSILSCGSLKLLTLGVVVVSLTSMALKHPQKNMRCVKVAVVGIRRKNQGTGACIIRKS